MAAKLFETIGKLGLGLALAGGVVNSALYNGEEAFSSGRLTCYLEQDRLLGLIVSSCLQQNVSLGIQHSLF